MMNEWVVFHLGVAALLFLDLAVLNRKEHVIEFKEALKWSAFWISLGLGFGFYIYLSRGIGLRAARVPDELRPCVRGSRRGGGSSCGAGRGRSRCGARCGFWRA